MWIRSEKKKKIIIQMGYEVPGIGKPKENQISMKDTKI